MLNFLRIFGIILLILIAFTYCKKDDNGSSTNDHIKPVITMLGPDPIYSQKDSVYIDPGATAYDDVDGDITSNIVVTNNVNVNVVGDYFVNYRVGDIAGNIADTLRVVKIKVYK